MKLNKRLLIPILTIVMVIVASCGQHRGYYKNVDYSHVDTIFYDYAKNENEIPRDSAFGNIRYIPLETTANNLIGIVDFILFGDSTIIIVDPRVSKAVFMFDYNGKYIGRISNLGNGHNEYRDLTYVCKRPDNKIVIADRLSNNLMVFSERGEFIENCSDEFYHGAIEYINMDLIAYDIHHRYYDFDKKYNYKAFAIKDINGKDQYQFGHTNHDPSFRLTRYYNLYSFDGKVYCNVNFEDWIYELGADSVKAIYRLEFGPENVTRHSYKTSDDYRALMKLHPFFNGDFIELANYTFISFRGEDGRDLIYDHATKQTYALNYGFNRPLSAFFKHPIARYGDNTMVCVLPATEIIMSKDILAGKPEADELFSIISVDSNPIIFFYDVTL